MQGMVEGFSLFSHFWLFWCRGALVWVSVFCAGVCSAVLCNGAGKDKGPGVHGREAGLGPAPY